MTATETPTIQTQSSPPPAPPTAPRRRRRLLLAGGLALLAAVAVIAWLLTVSSETQTRAVAPASAEHAQFCQNSPVLCSPAAPPAPNAGYVQFCLSSPTLCSVAKSN
ncbi:MAG TPA: hypothetical protein VK754_10675 [Propionibacteriaceae bacterium]|nr:hypothetical protein [Propionibacteriaceae bacterium]